MSRQVLVTGATGYLGRPLVRLLLDRGDGVRALVRRPPRPPLPAGAVEVPGNPLDADAVTAAVGPADTLVHLVGTPRPSPAKAAEFRAVDLVSIRATVEAAQRAGVRHLVYVSVAQPAPIMRAYLEVRQEGERLIEASGIPATILRPWYVLGPGHRWPYLLLPCYALAERLPSMRDGARRLGLVTLAQMVHALGRAVAAPANGLRVVEVPEIRERSPAR